jgi:hypothetical protein
MEDTIFDISFRFEGKQFTGWVNPSEKLNDHGNPVSFHVVLNGTSLGYLSFKDCQWIVNEERPAGLVSAVGKEIEKHYAL